MNQFFRTLVLLLVAGNLLMAGNPDLENGWKLFQENKRPQAGEAFKKALTSSDAQADAALAMSILSWTLGQDADALKYFMDFYSKSPDPAPYAFALWSTNCLHGRSGVPTKEQSAFYQTMLADSRSNGTINAMLQRVMQQSDDLVVVFDYCDSFGRVTKDAVHLFPTTKVIQHVRYL